MTSPSSSGDPVASLDAPSRRISLPAGTLKEPEADVGNEDSESSESEEEEDDEVTDLVRPTEQVASR